jgi:hypothetical protein
MFKRFFEKFKLRRDRKIKSDNLGSYTGVPEDPADKPVQDADDL